VNAKLPPVTCSDTIEQQSRVIGVKWNCIRESLRVAAATDKNTIACIQDTAIEVSILRSTFPVVWRAGVARPLTLNKNLVDAKCTEKIPALLACEAVATLGRIAPK